MVRLSLTEMTTIELRDALPSDSEFVFDVRRRAFREYVELAEGWNEDRELERHRDRFSRLRFRVIVADGSDAGYIATALYPTAGEYPASLYLHQLMIVPAFQSMRIGAVCLQRVFEEARELRMPLRLSVLRCNPRALEFYVRAGCRVVDESDLHISLEILGLIRRYAFPFAPPTEAY